MRRKGQRAAANAGHVAPAENPLDALAGAALYLAVVAYPEAGDSRKREKFMEALIAWRIKCCIPYMQHVTIRVLPEYSRVRKLHGPISKGFRCLERRLTAASMGWSLYWNRHLAKSVPQNPDCLYRLELPPRLGGDIRMRLQRGPATVNKAAQALVESRMKTTPGLVPEDAAVNIKHRVWAESLPVLHLTIALLQQVEGFPAEAPTVDKLLLLLFNTDWLVPVLSYAESLRTFLPSLIPTFKPERAVRLLPAGVSLR